MRSAISYKQQTLYSTESRTHSMRLSSIVSCPCRVSKDPRVHVWVAGVGSRRGADGVLRRLMDSAASEPSTVLQVNGRTPGLILQFMSLGQVGLLG